MKKDQNLPQTFNRQIANDNLIKSFLIRIESILYEHDLIKDAKEQILIMMFKDLIKDLGDVNFAKHEIDQLFYLAKEAKRLSK